MGELEEHYVREAFATNWISTVGPNLVAFEQAFSNLVGGLPCVALSSGTAAIHLGLKLLGVGRDDEVLCPTLTFAASANPVVYEGGRPVFIDSERETWNIDPDLVLEALEERARNGKLPKAVVVVHLYGQSAKLEAIEAACAKYEVPILEDAAEALGTHLRGRQVGTRSPVGVFSFNGNKIITTSGGGMLVSPRREWVEKVRFWSQQSREPGVEYRHVELGYNYRLSNVLAGIGRGQIAVLEDRVIARRRVMTRYMEAFADLYGLAPMPEAEGTRHTRWLSVFLVDEHALGVSRDGLVKALAEDNIEARPVWMPMHVQPYYANAKRYGGAVAEDLFARGICLPSSSSLSTNDQDRVIDIIRRAARRETPTSAQRESSCAT